VQGVLTAGCDGSTEKLRRCVGVCATVGAGADCTIIGARKLRDCGSPRPLKSPRIFAPASGTPPNAAVATGKTSVAVKATSKPRVEWHIKHLVRRKKQKRVCEPNLLGVPKGRTPIASRRIVRRRQLDVCLAAARTVEFYVADDVQAFSAQSTAAARRR
jgi:hypothetical protein